MPAFSKISHTSFSVTDAETRATWWCDVLGVVELERTEGPGWKAIILVHPANGTVLEVQEHAANEGVAFDPRRTGLDHIGFKVDDRGELDAWQSHLAALGVDYTPVVDREYGSVLTFRDPDGIQFEMFFREGHP